jgi:sigma-B regulation protein RsbU (phosphoserine phosphatase)
MVGATVNSVLAASRLRETNERLQRQVEEIARIQRSLLPEAPPVIQGLELAVDYRPHDRAGGDLYDFVSLTGRRGETDPAGRWAVIVGDVSGHGTPAAVVMAMLTSILYAYPRVPQGPAELLTYANRHLCAKRIAGTFTTALIGVFDPSTRRFTYARAGHPPALLKSGARINTLDAVGDLPLAVLPDTRYEEAWVTIEPGETLVLFTDGIIEEMDPEGRMFGVGGILDSLHACNGSPRCVIDSINAALARHRGPARPSDDATIVTMRAL